MDNAAVSRRSPPRLVKWPFFLGDALLILLAVFVLVSAEGGLNVWQIAFCVLAVVIGALLLVAPFVVEFSMIQRFQQEFETQSVETILRRINVAVGEVMEMRHVQKEELRKLEHTLSAYEGLGSILEQRLKGMQREDRILRELGEAIETVRHRSEETVDAVRKIESDLTSRIESWEASLAAGATVAEAPPPVEPATPRKDPELIPKSSRLWDKAKGSEPPVAESRVGRVIRNSESQTPAVDPAAQLEAGGVETNEVEPVATSASGVNDGETPRLEPVHIRASILIGIGNKIHVRGAGGGLSMDRGSSMQFVEIGLFEWVSEPVDSKVEVHLFLNDEIEAEGGPWLVRPGETLEVSPDFQN